MFCFLYGELDVKRKGKEDTADTSVSSDKPGVAFAVVCIHINLKSPGAKMCTCT